MADNLETAALTGDAALPFGVNPYSETRCSRLFQDVLEEPHDSFGRKDLALLNLLCAPGLSGSENLDVGKCLKRVDELTAWVKRDIDRGLPRFRAGPHDPDFGRNEAMWRMGMLITIVKRDFGARYRPSLVDDIAKGLPPIYNDSKDTFIHGLLADDKAKRWGSCASLPVLVTAISRRLGYPVRLAVAGWHVYCRWDTGRPGDGSFNIETSGPTGMTIHPDDYFRRKIKPQYPEESTSTYYLRSLTPPEEFGLFMRMHVEHLIHEAKYEATLLWSARSLQFSPHDPIFWRMAYQAMDLALKHRYKRRYPDRKIPADTKQFQCDTDELLAIHERCLYLAIMAHACEATGEIDEARNNYENACRQNFHGHNEQRDLQRFLRKHKLPPRTDPCIPPCLGQSRQMTVQCKPEEEVTILRRLVDDLARKGEWLRARDKLHDLYLFDPSHAETFQLARAIEKTPAFQNQLNAVYQQRRHEPHGKQKVTNQGRRSAMSYDPTEGRWISADPEDYIDGANLYQFVQGQPLRATDPNGTNGSGCGKCSPPPGDYSKGSRRPTADEKAQLLANIAASTPPLTAAESAQLTGLINSGQVYIGIKDNSDDPYGQTIASAAIILREDLVTSRWRLGIATLAHELMHFNAGPENCYWNQLEKFEKLTGKLSPPRLRENALLLTLPGGPAPTPPKLPGPPLTPPPTTRPSPPATQPSTAPAIVAH